MPCIKKAPTSGNKMLERPEFNLLKSQGYSWNNPFELIKIFEEKISKYTGAPYVTVTDCCTHAVEICLRYIDPKVVCRIPKYNYISIPMTFHKLGIPFEYTDEVWTGYYKIDPLNIIDMAPRFTKNCYVPGHHCCLSFGNKKVLKIQRGGAILTDNKDAHDYFQKMRYDGRDLTVAPWQDQGKFTMGFHYNLTPEDCGRGILLMDELSKNGSKNDHAFMSYDVVKYYPDLKDIEIN